MGFKEHMIEVSNEKLQLKGYQGDLRANKFANIRIKGSGWSGQNYVGGASNDLGWELMSDGTYAFHVSDYDVNKYNKNWQDKLIKEYSRAVVHEVAEESNFFIEEEEEVDGGIKIKLQTMY
jgi:hypothetical protein